jgi:hypothetical protein
VLYLSEPGGLYQAPLILTDAHAPSVMAGLVPRLSGSLRCAQSKTP